MFALSYAYGGSGVRSLNQGASLYHDEILPIVEDGSYADLEELREELGVSVVPWVQSEEDFAVWQERHAEKSELGLEGVRGFDGSGYGNGAGKGNGSGRHGGHSGNCLLVE